MGRPFRLEELRKRLRSAALAAQSRRFFHTNLVDDLPYLIAHCANGSTFRAYSQCKTFGPATIFRAWAMLHCLESSQSPESVALLTELDFEKLHRQLCASLTRFWRVRDGSCLSFAQEKKLIDLFLRHVVLWGVLPERRRLWLLNAAHVPLDKFTLHYFSEIARAKGNDIPPRASMGFISANNYGRIQELIKKVCTPHAPLHYDLLAWNRDHQSAIATQLRERRNAKCVQQRSKVAYDALRVVCHHS